MEPELVEGNPSTLAIHQYRPGLIFPSARNARSIELIELVARILGITVPIAGVAVFTMGAAIGFDMPARVLVLVVAVIFGSSAYLVCARGLVSEVEVDASNREVRVGRTRSSGRRISTKSYAFHDIRALTICRSNRKQAIVPLYLKPKKNNQEVRLLQGTEAELIEFLDYVVDAYCGKLPKHERPRMKITAQTISAVFDEVGNVFSSS